MKPFFYKDLMITPKRKFTSLERKIGIGLPFSSIGVSNYDSRKDDIFWSYKEFYSLAQEAGAGEIDVFEYKGMEIVPCQNELFHLKYK
ncbi:hypothetical protein [Tenacibaculum agarivorans]|uniref:hypothetical protein n=1 Tax=Tenacibaculum agarivorans TaxID=1908389 RepID=UPI00094BB30B|nr:hypothetical protein [Tenacibaculum agarivorans]